MVFIQENKGWGVHNESSRVQINKNPLDSIIS